MNLEVISQKENPLLSRKEVAIRIEATGPTPKLSEIRDVLAAKLNSTQSLIVLDGLRQHFGSREIKTTAKVYADEASLKKFEPKPKEKTGAKGPGGTGAQSAPAAPAEAKK